MFGRQRRRDEQAERIAILRDLATALSRNSEVTAAALSAIGGLSADFQHLAEDIRKKVISPKAVRGPDRAPRRRAHRRTRSAPPAASPPTE